MEFKQYQSKMRRFYMVLFLILMVVETVIALYVHDDFVRPYVGDILVVWVVYSFVRIVIPVKYKLLPFYVFLFAVCVEGMQYFDLISLLGLSDNRLSRIVLGSVADLKDVGCYAVGCLLLTGWEWAVLVYRGNLH